ncbi:sodium:solute symporter family protein [Arundinibacter roseus]|uniref:Sodium:solute symporter n=1 Tax=Arundinibacter roseus TaxID=2070510 RepID=A0A4R4K4H6_9BACT|nr:sodium:solute symporter family protein [Arundinibacter roseus]TDB61401.1 sodium:solute symporter [Arundinibacter roseus]
MKLTLLDSTIIVVYLLTMVFIGLLLKKQAEGGKKNYLLGGNTLPWYLLGLSNASGMFDISGTMWLVTLFFVYGLKSVWIPWLWPVFNQIFMMMFLSIWLRRSGVTTGAEWINTRFSGRGAALSHGVIVVFAIILGVGFLAYGFVGIGKFMQIFIPWEAVSPHIPFTVSERFVPHIYGLIFTFFAVFYSLLGGMVSIVWADVIQFSLMALSGVVIGGLAMQAVAAHGLVVPDGWMSPFFGLHLDLDWSRINSEVNQKITEDGYSLFSVFFTMMLLKGILVSMAGPAPTYDMQKVLSAKSPREAALMSGSVSLLLMPFRYFMIAGFGVLALIFYDRLNLSLGTRLDFEQILPSAIHEFVPSGWLGLLLSGLLAAFMSTFAGTLNATQAYIVNDIYLKYFRPKAENKTVQRMSYFVGIVLVLISMFLGLFAKDVNDLLQWIVSGLYGSYVTSNVLKWYWWRFNGSGFFWGMLCGLIPALCFRFLFPGILDLYTFPLLLVLSIAGCVAGTYAAPHTDVNTLKSFYRNVRPWGFWKPIHELVVAEDPDFEENKNVRRDLLNVALGMIWQTSLVIFPIYLVLLQVVPTLVAAAVAVVCMLILKKTWFDHLPKES